MQLQLKLISFFTMFLFCSVVSAQEKLYTIPDLFEEEFKTVESFKIVKQATRTLNNFLINNKGIYPYWYYDCFGSECKVETDYKIKGRLVFSDSEEIKYKLEIKAVKYHSPAEVMQEVDMLIESYPMTDDELLRMKELVLNGIILKIYFDQNPIRETYRSVILLLNKLENNAGLNTRDLNRLIKLIEKFQIEYEKYKENGYLNQDNHRLKEEIDKRSIDLALIRLHNLF